MDWIWYIDWYYYMFDYDVFMFDFVWFGSVLEKFYPIHHQAPWKKDRLIWKQWLCVFFVEVVWSNDEVIDD